MLSLTTILFANTRDSFMDKRSFLFIIMAALSVLLANYYFDSQHEQQLQQWSAAQKVKKSEQLKIIERQIEEDTVSIEELPIVKLYLDAEQSQFFSDGIATGQLILTLAVDKQAPKTIYMAKNGQAEELTLKAQSELAASLLIYQTDDTSSLQIGNLPDLGKYELQLVSLQPEASKQKVAVHLMEYQEGIFTLLEDKAQQLKSELTELEKARPATKPEKPAFKPVANGIILMKSGQNYLPVAVYLGSERQAIFLEDIQALQSDIAKADQADEKSKGPRYYVLENAYQQLVFSSTGAALTEINLPFQSPQNEKSVVRPIEFDRELLKDQPQNAHFPSTPYFTPATTAGGHFEAHEKGSLGGYYPLLRRDLIEQNPKLSIRTNPRFYALNLLSEFPELAELEYEVTHFDNQSITFEAKQRRRKITKTFSLPTEQDAPYCFDMTIKIDGDRRGLWVSSGVPEVELISGAAAPVLKYRITRNNKPAVEPIDLPKESMTNTSVYPDWTCNSNGFFGIIMDALSEVDPGFRATLVPGQSVPSRLVEIDRDKERFEASALPGYMIMTPLSGQQAATHFRIFAGPFSDEILNRVDATYSNAKTGYNPDYIACQSDHGWFSFISEPFAKILFVIMNFFHHLTGSWGISIILLTVVLRILMYPLNAWSTKSILKMRQISPRIAAIQEKYKGDPKRAQTEIMELYRSAGANPVSGCLPMLIQIPFLIGMFDLLKTTFELRGASFIPGWIDNLTSPDVLFSWSAPVLPLIGNQFHLLPILLGIVMFFQQRMMTDMPKDKSQMTEQQKQQKLSANLMSVVFCVMFYNFPSGLNIYWLSSTLLGVLQQWWAQKNMPPLAVQPTPALKNKK